MKIRGKNIQERGPSKGARAGRDLITPRILSQATAHFCGFLVHGIILVWHEASYPSQCSRSQVRNSAYDTQGEGGHATRVEIFGTEIGLFPSG
ncbi:hypothetical protein BOTBODRAFT_606628 [Botryobasidium botryosum FD-172 SS1]|uniref:Uncharacterized protein n=1 Tax=Botryobasidium botryosum (strain FD-172 SS1) TaxID=930990 RepID=A0A067MNV1_BOTB1|nr:hypothetical protein BOTBODRAFT_606628 [Botryobasidium botryosum FD-172 SS1]